MEEEKESMGKLTMEMMRQRTIGTEKEEERDRLSELPDCVLVHIMKFLNTEDAIQTCILSERWKNLWKRLTTLRFNHMNFRGAAHFNNFVSVALSKRDPSVSLLDLSFQAHSKNASKLLNRVMQYAVLHNVQQLRVQIALTYRSFFDPLIFSCPTLTFLDLCKRSCFPPLELPKSLQLPALKTLLLTNVTFMASDNGCAEPFSTCSLLNTLVLEQCSLQIDANVLLISSSNLSSLKLDNTLRATSNNQDTFQHEIVLSTPNLSSLTIMDDDQSCSYHKLSSTCNLSLLEEGIIHTSPHYILPALIISRLQVFTDVKILTLNSGTFKAIRLDLLNLVTMRPPCFVRLELLKIKMDPYLEISDEVNSLAKYLLQNSPLTKVAIMNC